MKTTTQLLGAVSAFALIAMSSTPALAEGTRAGTQITNNVTVNYNVNGIAQTAAAASDTFTVDRKVNLNVVFKGSTVNVNPGQNEAALAFDVTNLSNQRLDFALSTALASGTAGNISNFLIYRDTDGNGVLSDAERSAGPITFLDEVNEDQTIAVIVVSNIGLAAVNGDNFGVTLMAEAREGGTVGTQGAALVQTTGANNAGVDTVFADAVGATAGDTARDARHSALGTYLVQGAEIALAKASRIVSDPVNGTTNPKAIPGAVVEYCITVANNAGAQTATGVNVVDLLPSDVAFRSGFGIMINGDATCSGGVSGGTFTASAGPAGEDRVEGALSDVAGGQTRSLYFQVEIR